MPRWLHALYGFIVHRWTRYVLCWLLALALTGWQGRMAWKMYEPVAEGDPTKDRRDSNYGHTFIDFGGQWLIAHLFATGHGHALYSADAQKQVLQEHYPQSDEAPKAKTHDADSLFEALMAVPGEPEVNGPLYPPTHALLFAPFGKLPPRSSYHVAQMLYLAIGWVSGLAIWGISRGRIWWPVATMLVMIFPGFGPSLHLGQNPPLTLAIVLVGWWLVSRGWDVPAGIVWGFLAYKPVWAASLLLIPILTRRWRMLIAMCLTGVALIVATLPFVGVQSWFDWLKIGHAAADLYKVDDNWVFLSRDLLGIPRRWLLDFGIKKSERNRLDADIASWALWGSVFATTCLVGLLRSRSVRRDNGYGAAFLALGAWATCFHFIYYDSLVALFPITLLLTNPRRFITPTLLAATPAPGRIAEFYSPYPVAEAPGPVWTPIVPRMTAVLNSFVLTVLALLIFIEQTTSDLEITASVSLGRLKEGVMPNPLKFTTGQLGTPWDTFVLLALWVYCGARVLMADEESSQDESSARKVALTGE
jgi:hypothetical protein